MVTSFSLALVASHYYATNLTVVNSLGTTFELANVLLDSTRSMLYLQNCGHAAGCIVNEGTLSRCPAGWKQKGEGKDYVNVGISECISVYDNISVGSATPGAVPATLYADNGVKVANLTALNVTHPGVQSPSTPSTVALGGLLGLAFPLSYETAPGGTVGGTFFSDSPLPWLPVSETIESLALDLNGHGQPSSMLLGGYDPYMGDEIQWGLTQAGPDMAVFHEFNVFDLNLCGANMLGTSSSNWLAVIDTLSPCLTLPAAVFDSFHAWALNHTSLCAADASSHFLCHLPAEHEPSTLPTLTFRLNHSAPLLHLPLADLVLDQADAHNRRPVCVLRGANLSKDVHEFANTPITFGTLALRSLYAVIDLANTRVGMTNKASCVYKWTTLSTVTSGCAAPLRCVGQQPYHPQDNTCRPPPCADYLYQELVPEGTHCRFTYKAQGFVGLLALCLVLSELLSHTLRWRAAQTKVPGRRNPSSPNRSGQGPAPSLVRYMCTGLLSGVRRRRRRGGRGGEGEERVGLEEDVG